MAAGLLVLGVAHNQAHKLAPAEHAAMVWNVTGHALALYLLALVLLAWRSSRAVLLVGALIAGYLLQVLGCSLWWLLDPWPLVEGGEICSDRLHFPLGTLGLAAALLVAAELAKLLKGKP